MTTSTLIAALMKTGKFGIKEAGRANAQKFINKMMAVSEPTLKNTDGLNSIRWVPEIVALARDGQTGPVWVPFGLNSAIVQAAKDAGLRVFYGSKWNSGGSRHFIFKMPVAIQ